MNLKEEMMGYIDCANNWNIEEINSQRFNDRFELDLIKVEDAIKIAEKYAEQKCKEQKSICFKGLINPKPSGRMTTGQPRFNISQIEIRDLILNSPLATEEK